MHYNRLIIGATALSCLGILSSSCQREADQGWAANTRIEQVEEQSYQAQSTFYKMIQLQGGNFTADKQLGDYVRRVGRRIAQASHHPKLDYEFALVNRSLPSSWSLPGGKIGISRGLLAALESEDELAAVLAIEIVHSEAEHNQTHLQEGTTLLTALAHEGTTVSSPFTELSATAGKELLDRTYTEAVLSQTDRYAIRYLSDAGYDPLALVEFLERTQELQQEKNPKWISCYLVNHPVSSKRIEEAFYEAQLLPNVELKSTTAHEKKLKNLRAQESLYSNLDKAQDLILRGEVAAAKKIALTACNLMPREGLAYRLMGRCLMAEKNYLEAELAFTTAINCDTHYYEGHLMRGICRHLMGQIEEARKDLEKSLKLLSTAEGQMELVHIEIEKGDISAAVAHLELVAECDSTLAVEADLLLAQYALERDPARFVRIKAYLDKKGYLHLIAHNASPLEVADIAIAVESRGAPLVRKDKTMVRYNEQLHQGEQTRAIFTGVGPFQSTEELKRCFHAEVVNARLIRTDEEAKRA